MTSFSCVLIANRGEIACRIIRTLRRLGIRSVAVYSDADADARHVREADVAVRLGPAPAAQSYLNVPAVLAAAAATGAEAIHPGFGFLAENAAFARACAQAGIVFIGPSPEAVEIMGDKISAKAAVTARGVPTIAGLSRPGLDDDALMAGAEEVGFPLLIKPSAGGGGKGMHVVQDAADLPSALASARREAAASFGDDTLFLERYLTRPRHIEVQILADAHGEVIHLGERECSLQRRHQKVIEEAPSPLLDAATRARIGQAACETARSVGYRGAGTVEFLVEDAHPDAFFFMEMNTRLQVEHPVTEEVTGLDLVEMQLRIAAGEPLPLTQDAVVLRGHAIEARVYAEDPRSGFLPTGGRVLRVIHPEGPGVRVDSALADGLEVTTDYDPMLAKVIAHGADREQARQRLITALEDTAVLGIQTNVSFLRALLQTPDVARGALDTGLIERELDTLPLPEADARLAAEAALVRAARAAGTMRPAGVESAATGPWATRIGWRLGGRTAGAREEVMLGGRRHSVRVFPDAVEVDGHERVPASVTLHGDAATVTVGDLTRTVLAVPGERPDELWIHAGGTDWHLTPAVAETSGSAEGELSPQLTSPLPGTVILVPATDGARVSAGDALVVVEAMKMEHVLRASMGGTVRIHVSAGDPITRGAVVATIEPDAEPPSPDEPHTPPKETP